MKKRLVQLLMVQIKYVYKYEGRVGYLFTTQELNTVLLYWYRQREVSDHFYTTNEVGINITTAGKLKSL